MHNKLPTLRRIFWVVLALVALASLTPAQGNQLGFSWEHGGLTPLSAAGIRRDYREPGLRNKAASSRRTTQVDQRFAQAQQENALALKKFAWKSRTEIQKDGDTKSVQVAQMRYDSSGNVQKTVISSTQEDLPSRGLRGFIAKKKKKEFTEKVEEVGALAKSYSELPPDRMQRFIATSTLTPEVTPQQKLFRVEGQNVLQPGDSMTIWIDAVSRRQRRVEIQTLMDNKPVRIVSEFQDIPQTGPVYLARSQVNYDGTSMVIITENFDYTRVLP